MADVADVLSFSVEIHQSDGIPAVGFQYITMGSL